MARELHIFYTGFPQIVAKGLIMNDFAERLASNVQAFLPQLLAAIAVLFLGLLAAWLVSAGVRALLNRTRIDNRLAETLASDTGEPDKDAINIEQIAAKLVFWVIAILTLVAFFNILELDLVAGPLGEFLNEVFLFLPNLLSAGLLLGLAWIVAKVVRFAITKAASAADVDKRIGENVHPERSPVSITRSLANTGYWLVLLLFLPVILDALNIRAITEPVNDMIAKVLTAIPNIIAAALLIAIAYFVGRVISGLVSSLLASVGFNEFFSQLQRVGKPSPAAQQVAIDGGSTLVGGRRPSELAGTLILAIILVFASIEALTMLGFDRLATLIVALTEFLGKISLAVVVLAIGLFIARWLADIVRSSGVQNADLLARVTNIAVIIVSASMALRESGLAGDLVLNVLTLLTAAAAVAFALAFGLGGRKVAREYLEELVQGRDSRPGDFREH